MKRRLTVAAVSFGAGLLVAGVGTPAQADASQDWAEVPPVPQAVLDSVHGGTAAEHVANLDGTAKSGKGTTFGDPVRYVFLDLVHASSATALSPDDVSVVEYAAVQYVDGVATNVVVVDETGEFVQLGWSVDEIKDIEQVSPSEILAAGGPEGDLYEVSHDLQQVRPLNAAARDIVGVSALPVERFRDVKGRQMAARLAAYDEEYQAALDSGRIAPGDVLLGSAGPNADGRTVSAPVAATGVALALGAAYLALRQARRRRTTTAASL
ncbi:hypothetical protein [Cellulomonas sp. URHD0024]|uniref:hypothetical protein n=1 Tax=Cellulomonas sp. URHD0024 TaxID=1302620 RepID=UPI000482A9B4|nr:hypothetical protein [Cellulomonas sp. URHD0024]